jgi:hypothetical protein
LPGIEIAGKDEQFSTDADVLHILGINDPAKMARREPRKLSGGVYLKKRSIGHIWTPEWVRFDCYTRI